MVALGQVFVAGDNSCGALGLSEIEDCNQATLLDIPHKIKSVHCGMNYSILLTENNLLYVFGDNSSQQCGLSIDGPIFTPTILPSFSKSPIKQISCNYYKSVFVTSMSS
jgi:alpha-tubulin suppressor-like RCC1 family protein